MRLPRNIKIRYINEDFLLCDFENKRYDFAIGNPPFGRVVDKEVLHKYKKYAMNSNTRNICSFFLDKASRLATNISFVMPKTLINAPEFSDTRSYIAKHNLIAVLDFGEKGFDGVLVETIALIFDNTNYVNPGVTIYSMTEGIEIKQNQKYITNKQFPYWILYRNEFFDNVLNKLEFGFFDVFRDRQITNAVLRNNGEIRVIKSRNINDSGTNINNIAGYDAYINSVDAQKYAVYKFLNVDNVYLTPNMTYYPRVMRKPKNTLVNGSVAVLIPKFGVVPTKKQLKYFASDEYRKFYKIARNYQTRSLNIDACSVYFFGLKKDSDDIC